MNCCFIYEETTHFLGFELLQDDEASVTAMKIGSAVFALGLLTSTSMSSSLGIWISFSATNVAFLGAAILSILKEQGVFDEDGEKTQES